MKAKPHIICDIDNWSLIKSNIIKPQDYERLLYDLIFQTLSIHIMLYIKISAYLIFNRFLIRSRINLPILQVNHYFAL